MIGTKDKASELHELPLRLVTLDTGKEAIKCLKEEQIDTVVSRWNLIDMPEGQLLAKIIAAMPKMPTVAFIEPGNWQQEIMARSLGVTAVLNEDIDDAYFRNTICQLLRIEDIASVCLSSSNL
jgi:DNA-binding NtrC family response regulator